MKNFTLTYDEKKVLLATAREVICAELENRNPILAEPDGIMNEACGAFVTIHLDGHLRGCIGHIIARLPLFRTIISNARSSAFGDPRFTPVRLEELSRIDIEISVLSPLWKIEKPEMVVPGTHGIYISRGGRAGVLLPQVPLEQDWSRETFLTHGCYKAGLPGDAWKDDNTIIEVFTALVFGEKNDNSNE